MKPNLHTIVQLEIFNEIASGRLRPFLPENSKLSKIKHLVRDENTLAILKATDKKTVRQLLEEMDLTIYGYRSIDDIIIDIKEDNTGKIADVFIKPRKHYDLNDFIDIPPAPDQKSAYFLTLMADEFERIKIRANKVLESTDSIEKLSLYANKHIQKTKQIAHDARIAFLKLPDKGTFINDNSDVYILFVLNLFLIRLIVYYRKFFKPFVTPVNESEEDLRLEFYRSLAPHKKYPYIFRGMPGADSNFPIAEDSDIPEYGKKCPSVFSGFDRASTQPADHVSSPLFSENIHSSAKGNNHKPPKLQWCGQINVLVDIFYQMLYEVKESGKPILKAKPDDVAKMILNNFCDNNGNELSLSTIKTILQPGRSDKRPKEFSNKRVEIKKYTL